MKTPYFRVQITLLLLVLSQGTHPSLAQDTQQIQIEKSIETSIETNLEASLENAKKAPDFQNDTCTYSKEYITSIEYFRAHKEYEISDPEAKELSWKISRGCTGAARRFIKTTSTLTQTGVALRNALNLGLEFSKKTDRSRNFFDGFY